MYWCAINQTLSSKSLKWLKFCKPIPHLKQSHTFAKQYPYPKKIPLNFSQLPRAITITNATPCSTHVIAPWPRLKWHDPLVHALKYSPPRLQSDEKCFNGGVRLFLSTGSHSSRMHRQDTRAQNNRGVHHFVTPVRAQSYRSCPDEEKERCLWTPN